MYAPDFCPLRIVEATARASGNLTAAASFALSSSWIEPRLTIIANKVLDIEIIRIELEYVKTRVSMLNGRIDVKNRESRFLVLMPIVLFPALGSCMRAARGANSSEASIMVTSTLNMST